MAYHRAHGVDTRIVRIFNTYGPRMRPHDGRVVSNFLVQALAGQPLTVYGDGQQTRSFCYVSDLVEGLFRLLFSDEVDPVNLGNPTEWTIRELVATLETILGRALPVTYHPLPQDDPRVRQPDITRAQTPARVGAERRPGDGAARDARVLPAAQPVSRRDRRGSPMTAARADALCRRSSLGVIESQGAASGGRWRLNFGQKVR